MKYEEDDEDAGGLGSAINHQLYLIRIILGFIAAFVLVIMVASMVSCARGH